MAVKTIDRLVWEMVASHMRRNSAHRQLIAETVEVGRDVGVRLIKRSSNWERAVYLLELGHLRGRVLDPDRYRSLKQDCERRNAN